MQYLYNDGELFDFMDNETFDQIALGPDVIGDSLKFVKEKTRKRYDRFSRRKCIPG